MMNFDIGSDVLPRAMIRALGILKLVSACAMLLFMGSMVVHHLAAVCSLKPLTSLLCLFCLRTPSFFALSESQSACRANSELGQLPSDIVPAMEQACQEVSSRIAWPTGPFILLSCLCVRVYVVRLRV